MYDEKTWWYDIEVYKNYFLAYFLNTKGEEKTFEIFNDQQPLSNIVDIKSFVRNNVLIGFNNKNYDDVLMKFMFKNGANYGKIYYPLANAPLTEKIKNESDKIILKNMSPWNFIAMHNLRGKDYEINTIDIKEILIGQASLKLYGARAGSSKLQELPIDPDTILSSEQKNEIKKYCRNDLEVTKLLSLAIIEQIKLRDEMGEEFSVDLRSKSDAQIAEAVINKYYKDKTGEDLKFPNIDAMPDKYQYNPPYWIRFNSDELNNLHDEIQNDYFPVAESGSIELAKCLKDRVISYGNKSYKLGVGGIHSIDCAGFYKANDEYKIFDIDVASFYPKMILNGRFYPPNIGETFLSIYEDIVNRRLEAKAKVAELKKIKDRTPEQEADLIKTTNTMNALKITINGSFGKFGSKYSKLYSPDLLFHTTVSGQLTLLMLIERMEDSGIHAISANTDGVVFYVKRSDETLMREIVKEWEEETNLEMEYSEYRSIFYRDVNNYVAFTPDDKIKTKGVFVKADLGHNPTSDVIKWAAIQYLGFDVPVEDTIHDMEDVTQFLQVRTVKGGAVKNGVAIGKAIRWYYSTTDNTAIHYADNGNMVPNSMGGVPLMNLPKTVPSDLDYDWYINEADKLIKTVNVPCKIGQNQKVNKLREMGYSPCFMSHTGKTLPTKGFDFSRDEDIGTQTGFRASIVSVDGILFRCTEPYPSGWKSFEKSTGVQIIYGGVVALPEEYYELKPLPQWVHSMIWDYMTELQRVKVRQYRKGLLKF